LKRVGTARNVEAVDKTIILASLLAPNRFT
jgi:hypothetical protein